MQVRLEVSHKSGKKKTVNIRSDAIIGRSTECSLRIASSEISRQHCKLTVIESGVLVRDLGSANGTWVNGQMIPPDRDVAVTPGSRLSIGPVQLVVHYESSSPNIQQPGSTLELPAVSEDAAASRHGGAEEADPAADVAATLAAADAGAADDEPDAVATVVVDPGVVREALNEGVAEEAFEPESIEIDLEGTPEIDEIDAIDVAAADDAEPDVDEQPETAPAAKKGKARSLFGGLLKFGSKSKIAEPVPAAAQQEEAAVDEGEVVSPPEEAEEQDEAEAEYDADDEGVDVEYEEGEFEVDEEIGDEDVDEEGEVDEDLGDFFRQFEK